MALDKPQFEHLLKVLEKQNVFNLNMTLGELAEQTSGIHLETNTVAWDRYVYITPVTNGDGPSAAAEDASSSIQAVNQKNLNLNITVAELVQLAQDAVGVLPEGHVYTQDRKTFIVKVEDGES